MTVGSSSAVRPPAVAALFYPEDASELRALLRRLLKGSPATGPAPKAVIAPHAGYIYSGPIAARAYNLLAQRAHDIRRVLLLGPAHRGAVRGLALPTVDAFCTPLGEVPLDHEAITRIENLPQVERSDSAHRLEHSLEVHLPFLQTLLVAFTLVPLVVGWAQAEDVAQVLQTLWGGSETLIVISSDLSHYHPYDTARQLDEETARQIETRHVPIEDLQACGAYPINGLLTVAESRKLAIQRLDLRNSGDTAGDRQRVVGYGAWALYDT